MALTLPPPGKRSIAVDLDGTLLSHEGWRGEDYFGEPLPRAHEALTRLRNAGWHIIVWTNRNNVALVRAACRRYFPGLVDEVNEHKEWEEKNGYYRKLYADVFIDDRAWPWCGASVEWEKIIEDFKQRGWM